MRSPAGGSRSGLLRIRTRLSAAICNIQTAGFREFTDSADARFCISGTIKHIRQSIYAHTVETNKQDFSDLPLGRYRIAVFNLAGIQKIMNMMIGVVFGNC